MINYYNIHKKKDPNKALQSQTLNISQQSELKEAVYSQTGSSSAQKFKNIKCLNIKNANITDDTLSLLWTIPADSQLPLPLVQINLAENFTFFTDKGIDNLVQCCQIFPFLKKINLADNSITDKGLELLGKSKFQRLQQLIIYGNCQITSQGLVHLTQNMIFRNLKILDLHATSIDDTGMEIYLKSSNSGALQNINLSMNWKRITDRTLYALSSSGFCSKIKVLNLEDCAVTDKGMIQFSKSDNIKCLQALVLNNSIPTFSNKVSTKNNIITDSTFQALAYSEKLSNLRILELRNTQITSKGIKMLSVSLASQKLQILRISHCQYINDQGLYYLETIANYLSMKKIYINGTGVRNQQCIKFQQKYPQIHLIF